MVESVLAAPVTARKENSDFIRDIIARDTANGRYGGRVVTRFPPEPNGYLHIGHAKSIHLNFGAAQDHGGYCHLRMDDTNPETEDMEYAEAIQRDVRWLGFDWGDKLFFASDYYEQLYQYAEQLIRQGVAYVDSLNEEEIRRYRGSVTEAGKPSPWRERSVEENLDLFRRMRAGEFPDGAHVLRGKIDMAADNMKLRDPLLYRIRHSDHYRSGSAWCLYPMYDYAHPISDAMEGITHSICTLEFENNRAIYDWLLDQLFAEPRPHQYEFARLNLEYTIMSKRKLLQLVDGGHMRGWDDPRLPTIAGLRRRGYTPEAIAAFCAGIGVAKANSRVTMDFLEGCVRDDLNSRAPRVLAVLRPLKVIVTNVAAGAVEWIEAPYWPADVPGKSGSRLLPFSRELWIEQSDFQETPAPGFERLAPGREVRLRHAYVLRCDEVVKDESGAVIELRCTIDPETRSKAPADKRKIGKAIQWVSTPHAIDAEVRLYDRLLTVPDPDELEEGQSFLDVINPRSLEVMTGCKLEPSLATAEAGSRWQFERQGFFIVDGVDSQPSAPVFNLIVTLKDSYARQQGEQRGDAKAQRTAKAEAGAGEAVHRGSFSAERENARAADPLLAERFARYQRELGLSAEQADLLTGQRSLGEFFEAALAVHNSPRTLYNWLANEVVRELKGRDTTALPFTGAAIGELAQLVESGAINAAAGKSVFAELLKQGGSPAAIVTRLGLDQTLRDGELDAAADRVLADLAGKVAEYRAGKSSLLGMFTGQVIKATGGKANPQQVQALLKRKLES
jgi:glutaminyl-tRNA synthetase